LSFFPRDALFPSPKVFPPPPPLEGTNPDSLLGLHAAFFSRSTPFGEFPLQLIRWASFTVFLLMILLPLRGATQPLPFLAQFLSPPPFSLGALQCSFSLPVVGTAALFEGGKVLTFPRTFLFLKKVPPFSPGKALRPWPRMISLPFPLRGGFFFFLGIVFPF